MSSSGAYTQRTVPRHSILLAMAAALVMACSQVRPVPGPPSHEPHLLKIKIAETEVIEDFESDPAVQSLVREVRSQGLRFVSNISPGFLWVIASDEELVDLRLLGYDIEQVMQGPEPELHKRMVWGPSRTLPEG